MRVAILDYGAGNLHSLGKALTFAGASVCVDENPERCLDADALVLPGVGSFPLAAAHLASARTRFREAILDGFPVIGVCLGMQLLMERSDEGPGEGLGIVRGAVTRLKASRVPQIGWNTIDGVGLRTAYYANSYVCRPVSEDIVCAWSTHESDRFPAMIRVERAVGVQFHPEKSSTAGVNFLRALLTEWES
jgi:glutamine amidotransferase